MGHFANFRQLLAKKGRQMLTNLNFEATFGILSSFSISQGPIWYYFHVLIFLTPMLLFDHKCGGLIFLENLNFDQLIVINVKNGRDWRVRRFHTSCTDRTPYPAPTCPAGGPTLLDVLGPVSDQPRWVMGRGPCLRPISPQKIVVGVAITPPRFSRGTRTQAS